MNGVATLSLLQLLEDNGFGKLDETLFWEKLGIGKDGIYITDLGGSIERGQRKSVYYELFCRGEDDFAGYNHLQEVVDFLNRSFAVCKLPTVPSYDSAGFNNVTIMPLGSITNSGADADGRIIYNATGQLYYGEVIPINKQNN